MAEEAAHALYERIKFSAITAIGKDPEQGHQAMTKLAQQQLCTITVLHARRGDYRAQQEPVGVGVHMPFAPLDLLTRVITAVQSRKLPSFDALAVDDSGAG